MYSPIILASTSPRRSELLRQAGIPFETDAPSADETCALPAREAVDELSLRKARASAVSFPDRFVLAADTLVCVEDHKLGKPTGPEEAGRMLQMLSGRAHQVFTGVTVISPHSGRIFTAVDESHVTFDDLSDEMISAYVSTGDPLDKAGAYGVQGMAALFVRRLDGCFSGVVGLPLYLVRRLLESAGYPLFCQDKLPDGRS